MKKKLKQIIKLILAKKLSKKAFFENNLAANDLIKEFCQKDEFEYELYLINETKINIRNYNYSDYAVFKQIFIDNEYESILKIFQLNDAFKGKINIIDAGANVGFTSVYFLENFKNLNIFAVEPSENNAALYLKNTNKYTSQVRLYQNALTEDSNKYFDIDREFRDGRDWSIATKETQNGSIAGITVNEIIYQNSLEYVSLLKIDIEGAERFIFRKESDLSFLKITQIIAIEIHDEYEIRNNINELLIENNYFLFESGELTIGINKSIFR